MTLGELYAVIWAKTRHAQPEQDAKADMYERLQRRLGRK